MRRCGCPESEPCMCNAIVKAIPNPLDESLKEIHEVVSPETLKLIREQSEPIEEQKGCGHPEGWPCDKCGVKPTDEELRRGRVLLGFWFLKWSEPNFDVVVGFALAAQRQAYEKRIAELEIRLAHYENGVQIKEVHFDEEQRFALENRIAALEAAGDWLADAARGDLQHSSFCRQTNGLLPPSDDSKCRCGVAKIRKALAAWDEARKG